MRVFVMPDDPDGRICSTGATRPASSSSAIYMNSLSHESIRTTEWLFVSLADGNAVARGQGLVFDGRVAHRLD